MTAKESYTWIVKNNVETKQPEDKCDISCPECGGTGSFRGDTKSLWVCSKWTERWFRRHNL